MTLDFWFDFGSTYSYPAAMRIEQLAASRGVRISWRAFLLGAIFKSEGMNDSPFNIYPARGRYMWRDLERVCQSEGIPYRRPSQFPRNGLLAARIACWYSDASWLSEFVRAIFRANFQDDFDISDASVVARCLTALGQNAAEVLARAQSAESKLKLRAQTDEAARLGIFGAPFFMVGHEPFWGNDRLEQAISWYAEHTAQSILSPDVAR
ncbi:MAG: 2-hydroxychromene-2-carboxylate isomerase [Gammaproteobacteria bacterium]|nr:2-hydroxychromene-2-carboxylate isomerase [Gammaproteobacteria bacterium]